MKRKNDNDNAPLVMTEEYWRNTQLSIARHYGRVQVYGHEYWIVDKMGRDLFECTAIADREGREKAIEPGEPADLCRRDFMKTYRRLGRDRVLELLKQGKTKGEIEQIAKTEKRNV